MRRTTRESTSRVQVLSGNHAAAHAVRLANVDIVAAYPITPQTTMIEKIADFVAAGEMRARFLNAESEHSVMSMLIGASEAGARVFSATCGQGTLYMHEMVQWAGRGRIPIVMCECGRGLYAPIVGSWITEHDGSMTARDCGWIQLYCERNQEVLDTVLQAYRIAERISLPVMPCLDGFYLTHTYEPVEIPDHEVVSYYIPKKPRPMTVNPDKPIHFGWPDVSNYKAKYELHLITTMAKDVVKEADLEFKELFGRGWGIVEPYKCDDAQVVVMAMGSMVATCRTVVDLQREQGRKVGLVKVRLFSPFPRGDVANLLAGVQKVAVFERGFSYGHGGHLAMEVKASLYDSGRHVPVFDFVAGMGGTDATVRLLTEAVEYVFANDHPDSGVRWLGVQ